ncbi:SWI/SNF complex component SNF12-like protein [Theileria parva strain Muguga]|uniref:Uncharacterized protein n=1 Tax=Theileria parva TaxID=5875 RepID=Q4MYS9_THEPA|nr:SWI/SNF complex component SNF12-like protein [Theileria parva strain Muguga]EAN30603.1 SWI/SNF complex component SNF12-like protein [Theileria parva strain Muguga]|eukprot:XP_762886.1 hypothetical protein [Theileria parva strain Muguga]
MSDLNLDHLKETHPEESQFLQKLSSIEKHLDKLIQQQQNCKLYDPTSKPIKVRVKIYNTYEDQDKRPPNFSYSNVPPSRYTIYIKASDLENDENGEEDEIDAPLTKYFNNIMIDTPSGIVLWNRDLMIEEKETLYNQNRIKTNKSISSVKMLSPKFDFATAIANQTNLSDSQPDNQDNPNSNPEFIQPNYNGFDELHVNRLGFEECEIQVYLFPRQSIPVYSVSQNLYEFIYYNLDEGELNTDLMKVNLPTITKSIWSYGFKNKLFVEKEGEEVLLTLDEVLKGLFSTDAEHVKISEVPALLREHLFPARPVKLTHQVKLSGSPEDNETLYDLTLESSSPNPVRKDEKQSELDSQISSAENEVIELVHLRNLYSSFSLDPKKFITNFIDNKEFKNIKPFTHKKLEQRQQYMEPWVHYAIENYLYSNNRTVHDFISGIIENQHNM